MQLPHRDTLSRVFAFLVVVLTSIAPQAHAQRLEAIWYLRGEESIQAFIAHADQITIVSPQVFQMDSTGMIRGKSIHASSRRRARKGSRSIRSS